MSVLLIRKPSETRYAYGYRNGYIKGYGAELSHNATDSTFLINSGIFVIQGAEVKVDANGWSESVSGVTNKRYYTVYGEVNLALETAEIKSTDSPSAYPTIEAGDDLTQSTNGTARVVLYRFTATNGIISDVQKVIKEIPLSVLFIRKPSETPNIQNLDDIRMVRYAYGNQNGYIKGYGAELSHSATGSTFLINSGIFVVQGAEVKVDANGWSESVSGVINKRYYTVYGEVNLALQTAEIKSTYSPSAYPTIDAGDDLTQSTDGTARVLLYRFTATNSIIADVQKEIKEIPYSTDMINQLINGIESGEVTAKIAEYASVDTSKGTIEQRLTDLGFKEGSAIPKTGTYAGGAYYYSFSTIPFNYSLIYQVITNTLKRQGNYVLFELTIRVYSYTANDVETLGRLDRLEFEFPAEFKPKESFSKNIGTIPSVIKYNSSINRFGFEEYFGEKDSYLYINFGYEAAPIE